MNSNKQSKHNQDSYFFLFGRNPFDIGWVEIPAISMEEATEIFHRAYPDPDICLFNSDITAERWTDKGYINHGTIKSELTQAPQSLAERAKGKMGKVKGQVIHDPPRRL